MTININLKGITTPGGGEYRDIAYIDVEYNGNTYDWLIYMPVGVNIGEYLESSKIAIQKDIDAKEVIWSALEPKTKQIQIDPFDTNDVITVPIEKNEIVKPDYPDYYAKRRVEYPSIADQIGAIINPNSTPSFADIQSQIAAVKAKYPKPT